MPTLRFHPRGMAGAAQSGLPARPGRAIMARVRAGHGIALRQALCMPGYMSEQSQPKLPMPRNYPFQPASGGHTSILIAESFVGFRVAAIRQNAGFAASAGRPAGFIPDCVMILDRLSVGSWNCLASTAEAVVMLASGSVSPASRAHIWLSDTGLALAGIAHAMIATLMSVVTHRRSPADVNSPELSTSFPALHFSDRIDGLQ